MHVFLVPVRNDSTGELRLVQVECEHAADAQVVALQQLFHSENWRKATALVPEQQSEVA